jgi:hypothetical protein
VFLKLAYFETIKPKDESEINTFLVSATMPNMKETTPSAPTIIAIFVAVTAMLPETTNYGTLNPCNIQRENY